MTSNLKLWGGGTKSSMSFLRKCGVSHNRSISMEITEMNNLELKNQEIFREIKKSKMYETIKELFEGRNENI